MPFVPRGLEQIPTVNVRDVVITVHRGTEVRSNPASSLPLLDSDYATTVVDGVQYTACAPPSSPSGTPTTPCGWARPTTTPSPTQQPARRVLDHLRFRDRGRGTWAGCWPRSRCACSASALADPGHRRRRRHPGHHDVSGATGAVEIGEALTDCLLGGCPPSRAAPGPRWPRFARLRRGLGTRLRRTVDRDAHEPGGALSSDRPTSSAQEVLGDVIRTQRPDQATLAY